MLERADALEAELRRKDTELRRAAVERDRLAAEVERLRNSPLPPPRAPIVIPSPRRVVAPRPDVDLAAPTMRLSTNVAMWVLSILLLLLAIALRNVR